ncbi:hypothetical protein EH221_07045 [bacterium]|nr:MAG: hypothetical protein EH221_07045 [bacterium]
MNKIFMVVLVVLLAGCSREVDVVSSNEVVEKRSEIPVVVSQYFDQMIQLDFRIVGGSIPGSPYMQEPYLAVDIPQGFDCELVLVIYRTNQFLGHLVPKSEFQFKPEGLIIAFDEPDRVHRVFGYGEYVN